MIIHTKSIFARHDIPEAVISDNGPQYTSQLYDEFARTYQFEHITSSPYHPQGNGEAERVVGTIKRMLSKCEDPYLALLSYRTTPLHIGYSPSELLMSCTLRSTVPNTRGQRIPRVPDRESVKHLDKKFKAHMKVNFDSHHGARPLPHLSSGDTVWIPDRQAEASVDQAVGPESYEVDTSDGTYCRNRRDLIQLPIIPNGTKSSPQDQPETTTQEPRRSG